MKMVELKTYLIRAVKIVNKNLFYIPFLSLTGIYIFSSPFQGYSLIAVFFSFVLYPVVYGRLIEIVDSLPDTLWQDRLKNHGFNYFSFLILIGVPVFILSWCWTSSSSYLQLIIKQFLIPALINCLTIYALPLVFLTRQVKSSIILGIKVLFETLRFSIPLIILTLVIVLIKVIIKLFIFRIYPNMILLFGIAFIQNVINVYINLVVFTTGVFVLRNIVNERIKTTRD